MPNRTEKKLLQFIAEENLISPGDNILLAVSGGADSVCLLHTLSRLVKAGEVDCNIFVAHMNHQLRGEEANADERYVEQQAKELNIPCRCVLVDVASYAQKERLSFETAARLLRQKHFHEIANELGCDKIATAHHMDDNAETVVHRLMRGTGYTGLAGIWPKKHFEGQSITYIRPLLFLTREEVLEYLKQNNITWQHDRTNDETIYTRNRIRHLLMPELRINSGENIAEQIACLSRKCRQLENTIQGKVLSLCKVIRFDENRPIASLPLAVFTGQTPLVKIALIRKMLSRLGFKFKRLNRTHLENIIAITELSSSSNSVELPLHFTASNEQGYLILRKTEKGEDSDATFLSLNKQANFQGFKIKATTFDMDAEEFERFKQTKTEHVEWFDFEKVSLPLTIRRRQAGDRFSPIGLASEKRIGKFLTDTRLPSYIREETFVITDRDNIIWLCPVRACEKTKITAGTKKVLQIELIK